MAAYQPLFIPSKLPVLLVFLPDGTEPRTAALRLDVELLLERLRAVFGNTLKVTVVDERTHPEIVTSFGIRLFPALVLLKQGSELWRHSGPVDTTDIIQSLSLQVDYYPARLHSLPNVPGGL